MEKSPCTPLQSQLKEKKQLWHHCPIYSNYSGPSSISPTFAPELSNVPVSTVYINLPVLFPALLLVLMGCGPPQLWLSALLYTQLLSILWEVSFWTLQVMHWPSFVLWEPYAQRFKPNEAAYLLNEFWEAPT